MPRRGRADTWEWGLCWINSELTWVGTRKIGGREFIHIDHTATVMARVGGWKDHWEVLPTAQLVFFYRFVFRERDGPFGPVGWPDVGGAEERIQVLDTWAGGEPGRWPGF